jgi:hypothetical protein
MWFTVIYNRQNETVHPLPDDYIRYLIKIRGCETLEGKVHNLFSKQAGLFWRNSLPQLAWIKM